MLLLTDARVLTLDPERPAGWGVEIEDGVVQRVLSGPGDCERRAGTRVVRLRGRTLAPSFADAHVHLMSWSRSTTAVDLSGSKDLDDALGRLRRAAAKAAAGDWVRARNWNRNGWADPSWPTSRQLDRAVGENPAIVDSHDLHGCWLNSLALEKAQAAGLLAADASAESRGVMRQQRRGRLEPTGILREDAAWAVRRLVPPPAGAVLGGALEKVFDRLYAMGVTAVCDFDGLSGASELARRQALLNVRASVLADELAAATAAGLGAGHRLGERVTLGFLKLFLDGSLGSRTCWMCQPFEGCEPDCGMRLHDDRELSELARQGLALGLTLALHAIGDRANRQALDLFAALRPAHPHAGLRIEHAQLLSPADLGRLASLGVTASMQPSHLLDDIGTADRLWGDRSRFAYAFSSLLKSGASVAFGSDVPVGDPDPRIGLAAAVARQDRRARPPGGWYPAQAVTPGQAFECYTASAHAACSPGEPSGRIRPGFRADLVALEGDPLAAPVRFAVGETWISGQSVFRQD
ncbi:MAG: amidohydrolase family protein [Candidatus Wallbacteria bacterium]|nr:amidohydrolase family protein [Candidatus Wallbacteria bacterium]